MRAERELIWLVILYNSDFVKGWFKNRSASKKDFERLLQAPNNSKEFSEWFNEMRDDGCISDVSEEGGHESDGAFSKFMVDRKRIEQRINENRFNKVLEDYYTRDVII